MADNIWEWCKDWYDSNKNMRVLRGGSYHFDEGYVRCVFRTGGNPGSRGDGFRVVPSGL